MPNFDLILALFLLFPQALGSAVPTRLSFHQSSSTQLSSESENALERTTSITPGHAYVLKPEWNFILLDHIPEGVIPLSEPDTSNYLPVVMLTQYPIKGSRKFPAHDYLKIDSILWLQHMPCLWAEMIQKKNFQKNPDVPAPPWEDIFGTLSMQLDNLRKHFQPPSERSELKEAHVDIYGCCFLLRLEIIEKNPDLAPLADMKLFILSSIAHTTLVGVVALVDKVLDPTARHFSVEAFRPMLGKNQKIAKWLMSSSYDNWVFEKRHFEWAYLEKHPNEDFRFSSACFRQLGNKLAHIPPNVTT